MYSFIHSFIYSFILSFIYSFIFLFIHSFIHSFIHLLLTRLLSDFLGVLPYIHCKFLVLRGINIKQYIVHSFCAGRPRCMLIRSGCGSKHVSNGFESRPGRIFIIGIVHIVLQTIQRRRVCSASMILCTMNNPSNHWIRE